ncbi:hypothetical protein GCM10011391_38630 [Pullulanibacillus camelliae]|uniref:Uncharacterized protein n=1 Tax=Pullulanibacillus camelliae TaxID=1707096 RepID=A0A8J2YP22_9BACL|nr:hypothetical protein GCM10011391_38630 [Pullulanibacillus camelliae]
MPDQVDWSARHEILNTLKACVPESPLTRNALLGAFGKREIGKTPHSMQREKA